MDRSISKQARSELVAHENEAPFPLKLAKHFIEVCSHPGDTVLDPFVGSGTTLHACSETGRKGVGIDTRKSQIGLSRKRLKAVESELRRVPPPKAGASGEGTGQKLGG